MGKVDLKKWRLFLRDKLWNFPLQEVKGYRYLLFKWIRVFDLSLRKFFQDGCFLFAASLTYYILMSIVPILAVAFGIAGGFGFREDLQKTLLSQFQDYTPLLQEMVRFADKMLEQTKGGVIAAYGLIFLFWSVTSLFRNLEGSLNTIWRVKKFRSWKRVVTDYFSLMLLGPILYLLSTSLALFIVTIAENSIQLLPLHGSLLTAMTFLIRLVPYLLLWGVFTFLYLFMPNAKVRFPSAAIGGVFSAILYVLLQASYIFFQVGVSRYGAIYGSFAALPLFLIWVNLSWAVFLLGAEVSFSYQSLYSHEFEALSLKASVGFRRLLSLWIVHLSIVRFLKERSPIHKELLVRRFQIPVALVEMILEKLLEANLLIETKSGGYLPARPANELKIADVSKALDDLGTTASDFPYIDSTIFLPFAQILEQFKLQLEQSNENKLLKDVPTSL